MAEVVVGVTKQKAADNRRAIVEASERLFRERGIDAVGLNELMRAAGFTQGGFYNHFDSKGALAAEVVKSAMEGGNAKLRGQINAPLDARGDRLTRQVDYYLSPDHVADVACGCSIAALATDVRRLGGEAQQHFAAGLDAMYGLLEDVVAQTAPDMDGAERRRRTVALYSEMVGSLLLSRSVREAAPDLADEILSSGRATILEIVSPRRDAEDRA